MAIDFLEFVKQTAHGNYLYRFTREMERPVVRDCLVAHGVTRYDANSDGNLDILPTVTQDTINEIARYSVRLAKGYFIVVNKFLVLGVNKESVSATGTQLKDVLEYIISHSTAVERAKDEYSKMATHGLAAIRLVEWVLAVSAIGQRKLKYGSLPSYERFQHIELT